MGLIYVKSGKGPNGKPDPLAAARDIFAKPSPRMAMNDERKNRRA